MGNLDNFDPAISDALAVEREIILFDNAGVGASTGTAPDTVTAMAADAARFTDALGLTTVDLLGHSMGGEVAQMIALDRPDLASRLILVGTGPRGGDGMDELPADVAALFTKRDELGEDMWLPIMFSPSKEGRAAGRAFELWLLPDANHGSHFQYVDRFVRRVVDFLDIQPTEHLRSSAPETPRRETRNRP